MLLAIFCNRSVDPVQLALALRFVGGVRADARIRARLLGQRAAFEQNEPRRQPQEPTRPGEVPEGFNHVESEFPTN